MRRDRFALLLLVCAGACSHANKGSETAAQHSKRSPRQTVYVTPESGATRDGRTTEVVPPQHRERGEMATTGAIPDATRRENPANVPPATVGVGPRSFGAGPDQAQGVTPLDQGENDSDVKLTQQVRKAIVDNDSLSFSAKNVTVVSRDGTVTLRGTVPSLRERNLVIEAAKSRAGVLHVVDQLEVSK